MDVFGMILVLLVVYEFICIYLFCSDRDKIFGISTYIWMFAGFIGIFMAAALMGKFSLEFSGGMR